MADQENGNRGNTGSVFQENYKRAITEIKTGNIDGPRPVEIPESKSQSRMVVVNTVTHITPAGQPVQIDKRYSRWLESEEQPYVRRAKIGEAWQPIDTGWFRDEEVTYLHVGNDEGKNIAVQLTEEQKEEVAGRVLLLGIISNTDSNQINIFSMIRPGEDQGIHVFDLKVLRVRCLRGSARYTLSLLPS